MYEFVIQQSMLKFKLRGLNTVPLRRTKYTDHMGRVNLNKKSFVLVGKIKIINLTKHPTMDCNFFFSRPAETLKSMHFNILLILNHIELQFKFIDS